MKKLFTLLVSVFVVTFAMAQAPEGMFAKASAAPEIDGVIDEVWAEAEAYNIDKPFREEVPTFGEPGETTWQGLWTDEGIYLLLIVNDDGFLPAYAATPPTTDTYLYDKPEIYLDVNFVLEDNGGPLPNGTGNGNGHYQVAPGFTEGQLDGTPTTQANGIVYAFMVEDPNYIAEYFIPFTFLLDNQGLTVAKTDPIGFDVTLIDRDPEGPAERQRAQWANIGGIDENWSNMNDAGRVTFEGAEPGIDIETLVITGGEAIDTDDGTIQFTAEVTPAEATQPYKWVLTNQTGEATLSSTGLLTAVRNGMVMVKAVSADDFVSSNEITVTISNQVLTHFEMSYIKDGDFTMGTGTTPSSVWEGGAFIENGVMTITNTNAEPGPDPWSWTVGQTINIPESMKDLPFVLQFKAWADEDRIFDVDIEHIGGDFTRFGDSPDPRAEGGTSQWRLDLTTEPTLFTLEITNFSRMDTRAQKFNFFAGMALPKVYIDSIFLVTQEDFVLPAREVANSINKVYPNPVGNGNSLFVELSKVNTKVAIYNAVGQKMMEKEATGNLVKFDVSSLRQGLYFVKLSDGSVQKFVR